LDTSPGEIANPAVDEFLTTVVGRPDAAPWRWQVLVPDGTTQVVLLSELDLVPTDVLPCWATASRDFSALQS
jgi:hypothetical protein